MVRLTTLLLVLSIALLGGCRKKVASAPSAQSEKAYSSLQPPVPSPIISNPVISEPNLPLAEKVEGTPTQVTGENTTAKDAESYASTKTDQTAPSEDKIKETTIAESKTKEAAAAENSKDRKKDDEPSSELMQLEFFKSCDYVFKNFVDKNGMVDYLTLRRKKHELIQAAKELAEFPTERLLSWSDDEKMAFWLNAHNILTVKLIIDNYPIKPHWWAINYPSNSIKQITGAREKMLFRAVGFQYKLEEIEQDLIKAFKDPRVCFALSYATVSGGILRNEAYNPAKIDRQLDDQVRKYLARKDNFSIDKERRKIVLSSLLKLKQPKAAFGNSEYSTIKRFREKPPEIRAFLNFIWYYLSPEDIKTLGPMNFDVEFKIYNWQLNEKAK